MRLLQETVRIPAKCVICGKDAVVITRAVTFTKTVRMHPLCQKHYEEFDAKLKGI